MSNLNNNYIIKNSRKYYRATCFKCGKDRGYKIKSQLDKLCRSCNCKIATKASVKSKNLNRKICSIENCNATHHSKGFCTVHYEQHRRPSTVGSSVCCKHCKINFIKKVGSQKYCSSSCVVKAYAQRYPERVKESKKKYILTNKATVLQNRKEWYAKNKEKQALYRKSRSKINRDYWKNRRDKDPIFRIKNNFRNRLNSIIKGRDSSLTELLCCSGEELRRYLESKWQPGMSWDNYGKNGWHVDHIIPCSAFDFTDEDDLKKCWHHSNLQPLWEEDNLKKGNKID